MEVVKGSAAASEETKEVKRKKRRNKKDKGKFEIINKADGSSMSVQGSRGDATVEQMIGRMIMDGYKDEFKKYGKPKTIEI